MADVTGQCRKDLELSLECLFVERLYEGPEARKAFFRHPQVVDQVVGGRAHIRSLLDVPSFSSAGALFVAADVGHVLLTNVAVSTIGVRLWRVLGNHLGVVREFEELSSLH